MQKFNYKLYARLKHARKSIHLIAWGGSQLVLPFFLLYAFLKTIWLNLSSKIDLIYIADGLLAPLGLILKIITRKPVVATIHGRDIAFSLKLYQIVVPFCLAKLNRVICVSEALKQECIKRNIPAHLIGVIPNGIDLDDFQASAQEVLSFKAQNPFNTNFTGKHVLLTVGRLVPKKGVDSFLINIFPEILREKPSVLYLIIGDGPLKEKLEDIIRDNHLGQNALLLGQIGMDDPRLVLLYNTADIFVMPNVPTRGDVEGFGIVALEACAAKLAVVASDVDGISEAIKNNQNGILIPPQEYLLFARTIINLLNDKPSREKLGTKAYQFVKENFSWDKIASSYCDQFEQVLRKTKNP